MYIPFYSEIKDIIKDVGYIRKKGGFIYGLRCVYFCMRCRV